MKTKVEIGSADNRVEFEVRGYRRPITVEMSDDYGMTEMTPDEARTLAEALLAAAAHATAPAKPREKRKAKKARK